MIKGIYLKIHLRQKEVQAEVCWILSVNRKLLNRLIMNYKVQNEPLFFHGQYNA